MVASMSRCRSSLLSCWRVEYRPRCRRGVVIQCTAMMLTDERWQSVQKIAPVNEMATYVPRWSCVDGNGGK